MYIIMYKYSALKINRKSFPNNIKNPIAPAQRKQSPPSPSSPAPTVDLLTTNPMLPQDNMGSLVYRAGEASPSSCQIKILFFCCDTPSAVAVFGYGVGIQIHPL